VSGIVSKQHIIKHGQCLHSLAYENGFFWETLWDYPDNSALKQKREIPNVLYSGDVVYIPEKKEKLIDGSTDQRHKFKRKGVPSKVRLRILDRDGNPRENENYTLEMDKIILTGTTKEDGVLEHFIEPSAKKGKLTIGDDIYILTLGALNPIDKVSGIQGRLKNLGYYTGKIDEDFGPKSKKALSQFQEDNNLEVTGELDDSTINALDEKYFGLS
jgi:N-acetylmuramoyl-L-alanine amidase